MKVKQTSTSRYTPYAKHMLRIAVCDVLDLAGCHDYCESRQEGAEMVTASVEALASYEVVEVPVSKSV